MLENSGVAEASDDKTLELKLKKFTLRYCVKDTS